VNTLPTIHIFGDSFAASLDPFSWVELLRKKYTVTNYATNGSSEYRIWKTYNTVSSSISKTDIILFVHTSPYRVFLKDGVESSSRKLTSHPTCDLIFNDVYTKKEHQFIDVLESIWDDEYFVDSYNLFVDNVLHLPNSIHITFFEIDDSPIISLNSVWQTNRGTINHMSLDGNNGTLNIVDNLVATALANRS
jgi:hypothetical protein